MTSPIAYRWKTQINENAKVPSFSAELPELDHNEIVGWEGARDVGRFAAVFLDDSDAHPRVKRRVELTEQVIADTAADSSVWIRTWLKSVLNWDSISSRMARSSG